MESSTLEELGEIVSKGVELAFLDMEALFVSHDVENGMILN